MSCKGERQDDGAGPGEAGGWRSPDGEPDRERKEAACAQAGGGGAGGPEFKGEGVEGGRPVPADRQPLQRDKLRDLA